MPGPVTDVRAGFVRRRYHERFGGTEVPVPVEAIAEDLCGLAIAESPALEVSGMLIPAERRVFVNASEPRERRRFTLAHELGHWICQCLEGKTAPRYCRAYDVGLDPTTRAIEREANVFAAELLMPEAVVRAIWADEDSITTSARELGVSEEAMHWRLFNLGLAKDGPA